MAEQRSTPIPDLALTADISDGEFRTYALICHLCWRNHPKAERPYTELGYEELARLHPGNGLRAAAVRARIQHLVQLGLLVRERFDNVRWRTYPVVVSAETEKLGAIPDSTHSGLSEMGATSTNTQMIQQDSWVLSHVAPNCKPEHLGVIPDSTHSGLSEMGAMPANTQMMQQDSWALSHVAPNCKPEPLGVIPDSTHSGLSEMGATPANTQMAQQDSWVLSHVAPNCQPEQLGAIPASTQSGLSEMGATPDNTQMAQQDSWVLSHVAPNCKPEHLGVIPDSTQSCKHELGAISASTHAGLSEMGASWDHTQPAPDLTDLTDLIDPDQDQINQSDQGGVGGMDLLMLLSKLNPEPMSAEGIRECLHQPQLTAAWLAYVNDPGNGVQNPAAYLRRQVRRGKYPPLQAAACLPISVERRAHEQTRTLPNQLARPAAIAPALASLAVAPVAAPRWPLDAS